LEEQVFTWNIIKSRIIDFSPCGQGYRLSYIASCWCSYGTDIVPKKGIY
jgi:hypothetical protein